MPWEQHSFAQYVLCERTRILFVRTVAPRLAHAVTGTRGLPSCLLASLPASSRARDALTIQSAIEAVTKAERWGG